MYIGPMIQILATFWLKVRLLGEYHKGFAATEDPDGQDIDDPLYGNANGPDEQVSGSVTTLCPMPYALLQFF